MIFAAVGTQLPFRRLLTALDDIAGRHELDIIAQTADPDYAPLHIKAEPFLEPARFDQLVQQAALLVGHAGIGLILAAKRFNKPLILYPRDASLGEHRNDHQLATARALRPIKGVYIAWDNAMLEEKILQHDLAPANAEITPERDRLITRIRDFIDKA